MSISHLNVFQKWESRILLIQAQIQRPFTHLFGLCLLSHGPETDERRQERSSPELQHLGASGRCQQFRTGR